MRISLHLPLGLSLAAHVALGVLAVWGGGKHANSPEKPAVSQTEVGETFEVPEEEELGSGGQSSTRGAAGAPSAGGPGASEASLEESRDVEPPPIEIDGQPAPSRPHPARRSAHMGGRAAAVAAAAPAAEGAEAHGPPAVYGAAGERSAVDLATSFTRGFPQAASADARWLSTPFGSAGEAIVVLDIAPGGALVGHTIGGDPSPALRAGIERTLALIGAREFTSSGSRTRLRVSARVSPDQVHDGLHGDVFAIGGSFAQSEGNAFFALAIGRRIDVRVHALP